MVKDGEVLTSPGCVLSVERPQQLRRGQAQAGMGDAPLREQVAIRERQQADCDTMAHERLVGRRRPLAACHRCHTAEHAR